MCGRAKLWRTMVSCGVDYVGMAVVRELGTAAQRLQCSFLSAAQAQELDSLLMQEDGPYQFTLPQLMELAGLSVAHAVDNFTAVHKALPKSTPVVVVCGPGNNGGDGFVAARHLAVLGWESVEVVAPKPVKDSQPHFRALLRQAEAAGVTITDTLRSVEDTRSVVVDAVFGFSFTGAVRAPYDSVLQTLNKLRDAEQAIVCSVDVPSGWDVDRGYVGSGLREVDMVVSLTLPKLCCVNLSAVHYLGGRFLPKDLAQRYSVPTYRGSAQFVRVL